MVIGLNPSTADETVDDPTIRRCLGYARDWGFSGLLMTHLFSYRATDPKDLARYMTRLEVDDPREFLRVRTANLHRVLGEARQVMLAEGAVLAAWGTQGALFRTARSLCAMLDPFGPEHGYRIPVACLGVTQQGEPRHPLYLRRDAVPVPFIGNGGRLVTVPPGGQLIQQVMEEP